MFVQARDNLFSSRGKIASVVANGLCAAGLVKGRRYEWLAEISRRGKFDYKCQDDGKHDAHLSTQCAAVIAQFSFNNAAPHLCRYVCDRH